MEGIDTELLALDSNILSSQHGSVGRRLITISLNLHTSGNTDNSLTTSQISDVLNSKINIKSTGINGSYDKGIVERGKDAGNTKDKLTRTDLRAKGDDFLNFDLTRLLQNRAFSISSSRNNGWIKEPRKSDTIAYRSHYLQGPANPSNRVY